MARQRNLWTPSDFIVIGLLALLVAAVGGGVLVVLAPDWVGYVTMGVVGFFGQAVFAVGIIAKGVQVGSRATDR